MRKWICVPTIILCLLLVSCGEDRQVGFPEIQYRYQNMSGCKMGAVVVCEQEHLEWEAQLVYEYVPGGESSVEVVAPETIAGIKAVFWDEQCYIESEYREIERGRDQSCVMHALYDRGFERRVASGGKCGNLGRGALPSCNTGSNGNKWK